MVQFKQLLVGYFCYLLPKAFQLRLSTAYPLDSVICLQEFWVLEDNFQLYRKK